MPLKSRVGRHASHGERHAQNWPDDQLTVINLLKGIPPADGGPTASLSKSVQSGICSDELYRAISAFEDKQFPGQRSGYVDPDGAMLKRTGSVGSSDRGGANASGKQSHSFRHAGDIPGAAEWQDQGHFEQAIPVGFKRRLVGWPRGRLAEHREDSGSEYPGRRHDRGGQPSGQHTVVSALEPADRRPRCGPRTAAGRSLSALTFR